MKIFMTFLLLVCSYIAHAGNDMTIRLSPNQKEFTVKLAANPTTGFQWSLKQYDKNILQLSSSRFQPGKQLIGGAGEMWYTFTLNQQIKEMPKQTEILFDYARSFEPKSGKPQKVIVTFE